MNEVITSPVYLAIEDRANPEFGKPPRRISGFVFAGLPVPGKSLPSFQLDNEDGTVSFFPVMLPCKLITEEEAHELRSEADIVLTVLYRLEWYDASSQAFFIDGNYDDAKALETYMALNHYDKNRATQFLRMTKSRSATIYVNGVRRETAHLTPDLQIFGQAFYRHTD